MSKKSKRHDRKFLKNLQQTHTELAILSPFAAELAALVDRAYGVFGVGHVSRALEACLCNVCMTEETRQQIIATPNRLLEPWMIREYTNSAHGVPSDLDDLQLLLPRYMELVAQSESICDMSSDEALWRFGEARVQYGFIQEHAPLINAWGRALMLHDAWSDATDQDTIESLWSTSRLMFSLGFDGATLIEIIEEVFT